MSPSGEVTSGKCTHFLRNFAHFSHLAYPFWQHLPLCPHWCYVKFAQSSWLMPKTSFFLNLGNNHPNISMSMQQIKGSDDYEALWPLLTEGVETVDDMQKTIVFMNSVNSTQLSCKHVWQFFAKPLRKHIDFLHVHWTPKVKQRVMNIFRMGRSRFW